MVTTDLATDDLADDLLVSLADNEPVLGRVVVVLALGEQAGALLVVRQALSASTEVHLEA